MTNYLETPSRGFFFGGFMCTGFLNHSERLRGSSHGVAEGAVERILVGEIDVVVAFDGYTEDGLTHQIPLPAP